MLVGATGLAGVTVRLTSPTPAGFAARTFTTTATGAYTFANLPAGRTYVVTPTKLNYKFTPATRTYSGLAASQTAANFAAALKTYSISGRVVKSGTTRGIAGVAVAVTSTTPAGFVTRTVQTTSTGGYTLTDLPAGGSYTVNATLAGYTFSPAPRNFNNLTANQAVGPATNFAGTQ